MMIFFLKGAFRLYDLDNDGTITKTEMTQIVEAIFSMVGNQKDQMPNEVKGFHANVNRITNYNLKKKIKSSMNVRDSALSRLKIPYKIIHQKSELNEFSS